MLHYIKACCLFYFSLYIDPQGLRSSCAEMFKQSGERIERKGDIYIHSKFRASEPCSEDPERRLDDRSRNLRSGLENFVKDCISYAQIVTQCLTWFYSAVFVQGMQFTCYKKCAVKGH